MFNIQKINISFIIIIALFLCFFCWSLNAVYSHGDASIYQENGLLENIQASILFITFLVFLLPTLYQKRNDKLIFIFFSLLCFNFILREIDVENFDLPKAIIFIGSGIGRKVLLAIGFISILFYAFYDFKYYANLSKKLIQSKAGILIFTTAIFLFLGGVFEDYYFQHHEYFEEISELAGYILLLMAALISFNQPLTTTKELISKIN